jgi:subtilase family serine protease
MRSTQFLRMLSILLIVCVFSGLAFSQTVTSSRILQAANDQQITRMKGNISPLVARALDKGALAPSTQLERVTLVFKRTPAQQQALDTLLEEQQNPASPNYHNWLTPEQFADRFGLNTSDISKVTSWLQSHGLQVVDVARGRNYVSFTGTAAQIAAAFHTQFHQYVLNGRTHYANSTEPSIPSAFADVVSGIQALNDFRPKPRATLQPKFTSSISGNHFVAPPDFTTIYNLSGLYNAGITGAGQKIVVVGQTDINISDITAFRTAAALPTNNPVKTLVPGITNPGIVSGDITEADLDVEWSGAVAKDAQILYIFSNNVFTSMQYAINNNLAPVISISYGDCEPNFQSSDIQTLVSMAQQANSQGQTIVGPSGDDAASDCDYPPTATSPPVTIATQGLQVDVPASLPYVTGVGGTAYNEGSGTYWNTTNTAGGGSAISYIPEMGWNDTMYEIANGGGITGTGGGKSTLFSKPSWQTGTGVPNDGARDVPDLALNASVTHDGYLICSQGSCPNPSAPNGEGFRNTDSSLDVVGGTSAGAPTFAGIVALINQQSGTTQGNINPKLYSIAASTPAAFHDVTTGNNIVPCQIGTLNCTTGTMGYTAGPGYDQVTGLGSVDATALAAAIGGSVTPTANFQVSLDNASLSILHGTSKSVNVTISPTNGFTGAVNVSCAVSSSLLGTTCTVNTPTINTSGSTSVTINASPTLASAGHSGPFSPRGWLFETGFALSFGAILTVRNRRRMLMIIGTLVLAIAAFAWTGCGGGSSSGGSNLPSLTGTVTISATSGTITNQTHVTVTVY